MNRIEMYCACLLVHGPPPQRLEAQTNLVTHEFLLYRHIVHNWLDDEFKILAMEEVEWFEDYLKWFKGQQRG